MQRLNNPQEAAQWLRARVRGVLHTDSRRVRVGDGFVAWPGGVSDGRAFVPMALTQGASACVVEHEGAHAFAWEDTRAIASYQGLKAACGPIAHAYYEQPSHALDVLAVTGTNGKTSTAWWLAHALQNVGKRCAMVGTLGVGEANALEPTGMTTPDPVLLQARLRDMANAGVQACAVEASSIGLAEHRLDGTRVRVALFTNFTQDHLDYHGSMAQYWQAKLALFDWPGLEAAVVNVDDPYGAELAQQMQARTDVAVWTVSCTSAVKNHAHHITARHVTQGPQGLSFEVVQGDEVYPLHTALVGQYNVRNVLGVMAALRAMGYSLQAATQACQALPAVPGRMQVLGETGQPLVVVDYAHTPDAVAQATLALLPLAQARGGELTCVLGCGGERDATKRPLMAAAARRHAHHVVLTSDNPRNEDPQAILDQMRAGLSSADSALVIRDRAQAIAQVVQHVRAHDVVLIAGKGHEQYQDIAGVKHPFSDVAHAQAALQDWRPHD